MPLPATLSLLAATAPATRPSPERARIGAAHPPRALRGLLALEAQVEMVFPLR
jgi:hypothetical protein